MFRATVGGERHCFPSLGALMAEATPLRSGDQLAGLAADSQARRVAAQWALADLPLTEFLTTAVGGAVSLYDVVPDRSQDPLVIVLLLELFRELRGARSGVCAELAEEYMAARHAEALELLDEGGCGP